MSPRFGLSIRNNSFSEKGSRKEYLILLTKRKSPIFKVGIMEPEGILLASKMDDLKAKTKTMIPIKDVTEEKKFCFSSSLGSG
jgi:hypothetical protein